MTLDFPAIPALGSVYQGEVIAVNDPAGLSRVQVRLLAFDGFDQHDAPVWARVATPFAGADRGAFFIPNVGDEVLIAFLNGDSRVPIVIGGLWNGNDKPPETLGGSGDRVDRWSITGVAGTRIAIVEEQAGQPEIHLSTPGGVTGIWKDQGSKIELKTSTTTVTLDPSTVTIETSGRVEVKASQVEVTSGQVTVNAAVSTFSGVVRCDVLQATTVISSTYTPGAGNVW